MAPDNNMLEFLRDYVFIPIGTALVWMWSRNEKEHEMLRERTESIKQNTSDGYSTLNDRVMVYVDGKVNAIQDEQRRRSDTFQHHITKLFENAEKDRASFREELSKHSQQSAERHIELLSAIHTGLAGKADK